MSDDSDIEMKTKLPKKQTKKPPKSPSEEVLKGNEEQKRPSTKIMVHQALKDLKSRKGTSLYAIKKYIQEKFSVDVEKINYIIKKLIKAEVEAGTIVQIKGVGASGSFKLVPGKEKVEKKKDMVKKISKKSKGSEDDREAKMKSKKTKGAQEKSKAKSLEKKIKKKDAATSKETSTKVKEKDKDGEDKNLKEVPKEQNKPKAPKSKSVKAMKTPAKKRAALLKRKSIGSIIKPPKMRPKANG